LKTVSYKQWMPACTRVIRRCYGSIRCSCLAEPTNCVRIISATLVALDESGEQRLAIRRLLLKFISENELASAQGAGDISAADEALVLALFREVYELPKLRNLNEEKVNFPGIDLADDESGVGIQVTLTTSLGKVRATLEKVVRHDIYQKYPDVRIFVTTRKQRSYSQAAIDSILAGRFSLTPESRY